MKLAGYLWSGFLMFSVFHSCSTFAQSSINLTSKASVHSPLELPVYSKIYDDKADPFQDAKAAIKLAQETNRNVLIEIGGNWCTWCHKMDAFLAKNPDIYQDLHQKYVLLKVNVSDSNENEAFMKALPPTLGYPHMYVSTASGKMILSKDTAELLQSGEYSRAAWQAFLAKWQVKNNQANISQLSKVAS